MEGKIEELRKFLVEEFYVLSIEQLKRICSDFNEVVERSDDKTLSEVVLSEDLELVNRIYKQYQKAPLGVLIRLFYLLKDVSTNLIWSGFVVSGDATKKEERMFLTLRPVRFNVGSINLVEQVYSVLSKDFSEARNVVLSKYDINSKISFNNKILAEGLVSLVRSNKDESSPKYELYFYNMQDKTEFDFILSSIIGLPAYVSIISSSHYYIGNISEFNRVLKEKIADVVGDDLMFQSKPLDILNWFNTKMVNKDKCLGIKYCEVSGLPLAHFGNYHDGTKANFY